MRKSTRLRLLFFPSVLAVALLAGGCAQEDANPYAQAELDAHRAAPSLAGTDWTLIGIDAKPVVPAGSITLVFDYENGLAGRSAVNRYKGAVGTAPDGKVVIGNIVTTRMAGPENLMALERSFLSKLSSVTSVEVVDGVLVLGTAENSSALVFAKADAKAK